MVNYKWRSTSPRIATVDENGLVTAHDVGLADIELYDESNEFLCFGRCEVLVKYKVVTADDIRMQQELEENWQEMLAEMEAEELAEARKIISMQIAASPSKKIAAGKKTKLTVTVKPDTASNNVTWSTSNKKWATVNSKGVVKTKKAGIGKTVTITATAKDGSKKTAKVKIKIVKDRVISVTVKAKTKSVKAGKKLKLNYTVKGGSTANKKLSWTSSNPAWATVKNGTVTTKAAGKGNTVTITAKATDGTGKKAKIKIKIK